MADKSSTPRLLLTRPVSGAERVLSGLQARGVDVKDAVISPALLIAPIGDPVYIGSQETAIFTSVHGVNRARGANGAQAICVGNETALHASERGFNATSAGGNVEDLIALIDREQVKRHLKYIRGKHTRQDLRGRLSELGFSVSEHVAYDQVAQEPNLQAENLLSGANEVVLPLFSPRSAAIVSGWTQDARAPIFVLALSEAVAHAFAAKADVVSRPDLVSMLDGIESRLTS